MTGKWSGCRGAAAAGTREVFVHRGDQFSYVQAQRPDHLFRHAGPLRQGPADLARVALVKFGRIVPAEVTVRGDKAEGFSFDHVKRFDVRPAMFGGRFSHLTVDEAVVIERHRRSSGNEPQKRHNEQANDAQDSAALRGHESPQGENPQRNGANQKPVLLRAKRARTGFNFRYGRVRAGLAAWQLGLRIFCQRGASSFAQYIQF